MNRRDFLLHSVATSSALVLPAQTAWADGHVAKALPTVLTYKIGDMRVSALSDGFLPFTPDSMIGIDAAGFKAALMNAHIQSDTHPTGVNAYLVENEMEKTLIDAGTGTLFGPNLGKLSAQLDALGVASEDITRLVATHLHPDHIGGVLMGAENPFPNAELVVSETELSFWTSDEIRSQWPEAMHQFFDMGKAAVDRFGERIRTVSGEASIASGMTAMPLPGHTAGHMGVMLEGAGDNLLIWGDIIHVGPIQFAQPEVTITFDADPDMAAKSRKMVLDMVATDDLKVAGSHIDFPGVGYVTKAGSGYRWHAAPYPYG